MRVDTGQITLMIPNRTSSGAFCNVPNITTLSDFNEIIVGVEGVIVSSIVVSGLGV